MEIIVIGIIASLAAGLATSLGTIPIFLGKEISDRNLDILLGFAAGVMLAASAFSLLVPALNMEPTFIPGWELEPVFLTVLGFTAGALFIHVIDRWAPHQHFITGPNKTVETIKEGSEKMSKRLAATWLFVIAITIHNFPEGLAVGVAFGAEDISTGIIVALAIGLQNIPEGTAVALPLVREGYTKFDALKITLATGLVEPLGGLLGVTLVTLVSGILGFGMSFAAGAMIFVVSDEIIPESHRKGHERPATFGVIIGFVVMMFLDNFIAGA
ncbi:MAG: ZIP family metal transporter [Candidatus Hodarchaeales archaeon]|jgi:ZIP family zinc transporter